MVAWGKNRKILVFMEYVCMYVCMYVRPKLTFVSFIFCFFAPSPWTDSHFLILSIQQPMVGPLPTCHADETGGDAGAPRQHLQPHPHLALAQ